MLTKKLAVGCATLLAFLGVTAPLTAQPLANDPYKWASPADGPAWYDVNSQAWTSFSKFSWESIFGKSSQQDFSVSLDYASRYLYLGKKAAGASLIPEITWVGPFFGGEGYTAIDAVQPLESPFAQKLDVKGGWRYHLTDWVNIDLGGHVILFGKSVFGQGMPAPWGGKSMSPIYAGFMGRVWGEPSFYYTYDPNLGQSVESLSASQPFDMKELLGIANLTLRPKFTLGFLQANDYNLGNKVLGQNWRNGYTYFEATLDADYELLPNFYVRAGGTWAINSDGSGSNGIAKTNLGPDDNLAFHAGVVYAF